jgi:TonB family protein
MIATKSGNGPAAPLCAGLAGSTILHAALFVVAAAIPAGLVVVRRGADDADRPLSVTVVVAAEETAPPLAAAEQVVSARVPPSPPETIELPDWTAAEPPPALASMPASPPTPPRDAESRPARVNWSRLSEMASLCPGRGGARHGTDGSSGGGAIGVGGTGGDGGGEGGRFFGSATGSGAGDGGDGTGTGWAPRGGETRGPAIVTPLAAPSYPAKARAHGWEGRVVLVLTIDERGRVTAVEIAESSGRTALDDAAREAAGEWTLAPALRDGEPVAGTLRVPVRFELTD